MQYIIEYAAHIQASEEVRAWLNTTGTKAIKAGKITESDMEHVLDYLVSASAPKRLQKMSFADASRKSKEWSKASQKKGRNLVDGPSDISTLHNFSDGSSIVRLLTKSAYQREGFLMGHCVGNYDPNKTDQHIYSYRDSKNLPHATFEVNLSGGEIMQIKGKGNGTIHPKYVDPILVFLETIGMRVRPADMVNLGYYHVHKDVLGFLQKIPTVKLIAIKGEFYAY